MMTAFTDRQAKKPGHNPQDTINDFLGFLDDTTEAFERDFHLK